MESHICTYFRYGARRSNDASRTVFMEPTTGIEPVNLFLTKEVLYLLSYVGADRRGTLLWESEVSVDWNTCHHRHLDQLAARTLILVWSGKRDSNPRRSAWKADALPTELFPRIDFELGRAL